MLATSSDAKSNDTSFDQSQMNDEPSTFVSEEPQEEFEIDDNLLRVC